MKKADKLQPLADFILVERVVHDSSGLIVAEHLKDDSDLFSIIVVRVGPAVTIDVAPNDELWCVAGVRAISTDVENHFFIKQDHVCGKIKFNA